MIEEIDGGHKYGNFKNYYNFHPTSERTSRLPHGLFRAIWEAEGKPNRFFILDVGCNEGDLSLEIFLKAERELASEAVCYLLGIDIDSLLIERARGKSSHITNAQFVALDFMNTLSSESELKEYLLTNQITSFSFVSCFSITMWIHMNQGDEGLTSFLDICMQLTSNTLLVEPQPWKCYRQAMQRCRRLGLPELPHFQDLCLRDIESHLCQRGTISGLSSRNELEEREWKRKLIFFHRINDKGINDLFEDKAIEEEKVDSKKERTSQQKRQRA